jgi:signal transduction histidine kinase
MAATVAEVDRMKSEFVTTASHELRTPIHSMLLGVSGLLAGYGGEISEEVREDLLAVQEGIDRLRRLVDNMLDLSRIESRRIEIQVSKVEAKEIIETARTELGDLVSAHHHEVVTNISDALPPLMADRDRLIQLMVNLLSNSIKYTPLEGKIIVKAESDDGRLVITVADNGYGIPSWAKKKVFERFFQADQIMSQRVGGSGLGLTISRWIVEEHGGDIEFVSPIPAKMFPDLDLGGERKGTVFFVHLPLDCTQQGVSACS